MNLENKSPSELKQLHLDICSLCEEIDNTEITAGNKEQLRDSIIQRLHSLPLASPYDELELQPSTDATVRAEIEQMGEKLTALKAQLETHLGMN